MYLILLISPKMGRNYSTINHIFRLLWEDTAWFSLLSSLCENSDEFDLEKTCCGYETTCFSGPGLGSICRETRTAPEEDGVCSNCEKMKEQAPDCKVTAKENCYSSPSGGLICETVEYDISELCPTVCSEPAVVGNLLEKVKSSFVQEAIYIHMQNPWEI